MNQCLLPLVFCVPLRVMVEAVISLFALVRLLLVVTPVSIFSMIKVRTSAIASLLHGYPVEHALYVVPWI